MDLKLKQSVPMSSNVMMSSSVSSSLIERPFKGVLENGGKYEKYSVLRSYRITKRVLDICGALIGLGIFLLFLPFLALLIWWEDHGTIFYRYVCVGQGGQPFFTYKLRSMRVDADAYLARHPELSGEWKKNGKLVNDPRITCVGRFIRATSIDEFPQLLNVLRGEMSLVGPRFIQFSEVDHFGELIDLRQQVKPGLTGLWQVSGRSKLNYEQRAVLDCIYVLECSFYMDMLILFKTVPAVLRGVGAY